jgi:hypothetical protein
MKQSNQSQDPTWEQLAADYGRLLAEADAALQDFIKVWQKPADGQRYDPNKRNPDPAEMKRIERRVLRVLLDHEQWFKEKYLRVSNLGMPFGVTSMQESKKVLSQPAPCHDMTLREPGGTVRVFRTWPIAKYPGTFYCKYCYQEHSDWWLMEKITEPEPGDNILCGVCGYGLMEYPS